ncbi:NAD(P)-dependent alcohol dehydrogenase [Jatrophihabitans sp.]|uniref:NAD(P)-dependent alcohol dehydrogenase n=1 Tax=Jatrophihabitans sp. TaxID=1932789 RepID=UPI0030C73686|nr:hydroxyacid dehydrogenase [Jatrophihabitans sp.]
MTTTTTAWAAADATSPLEPIEIPRRELGPLDVAIDIEFCGICHSDIHTARNEWHGTSYPVVPGHEIVGRVSATGSEVTRHAVGDRVGVGCMVDSCGECESCVDGEQNYCQRGAVMTYNSRDRSGTAARTYGGYSGSIVVTEGFVVSVPEGLDAAAAAPILCAGVTMYSPLKHHKVGPGSTVGIAGFGGLGSMGVKLAKALGAEVTVITRSDKKSAEALKAGADHVLVISDAEAVRGAGRSLDLILSTIPSTHDLGPYLGLLKRDGAYVVLGAIEPLTTPIHGGMLAGRRINVTGSMIGGIPETQDVLDFCAEHGIASDVQVIGVDGINDAYDQLAGGDPGYRFVIDMSTLQPV